MSNHLGFGGGAGWGPGEFVLIGGLLVLAGL